MIRYGQNNYEDALREWGNVERGVDWYPILNILMNCANFKQTGDIAVYKSFDDASIKAITGICGFNPMEEVAVAEEPPQSTEPSAAGQPPKAAETPNYTNSSQTNAPPTIEPPPPTNRLIKDALLEVGTNEIFKNELYGLISIYNFEGVWVWQFGSKGFNSYPMEKRFYIGDFSKWLDIDPIKIVGVRMTFAPYAVPDHIPQKTRIGYDISGAPPWEDFFFGLDSADLPGKNMAKINLEIPDSSELIGPSPCPELYGEYIYDMSEAFGDVALEVEWLPENRQLRLSSQIGEQPPGECLLDGFDALPRIDLYAHNIWMMTVRIAIELITLP